MYLLAFTTSPILHHNEPSRESNFCGKVGAWLTKVVAIMLNYVLKTLHECDRCSVVAVRFFSSVVGFLCGVSFICRALGWLFPIV